MLREKVIIASLFYRASSLAKLNMIMITECNSKEPESFCSCELWNCCSWGWGNRYVIRWTCKMIIVFALLSVCLNMRLPSVLTLYIINRSGTLIKGCEGYNHQHTCKWGNSLCFIFCHLIVYSFFLFSEVEINLTFRERENFRTESILMLKAYSGFHEFEESIYHCFICRLLEKLLLWRAWMHGYEKYAVT